MFVSLLVWNIWAFNILLTCLFVFGPKKKSSCQTEGRALMNGSSSIVLQILSPTAMKPLRWAIYWRLQMKPLRFNQTNVKALLSIIRPLDVQVPFCCYRFRCYIHCSSIQLEWFSWLIIKSAQWVDCPWCWHVNIWPALLCIVFLSLSIRGAISDSVDPQRTVTWSLNWMLCNLYVVCSFLLSGQ
jgi:hypothetical protein